MKILVVDDHQFNRELLGFILSDNDYEYLEAENGRQACELVEANADINLVLMDINMPVMDGYQATEEIKRNCSDRHIPIIFITALDNDETLSRCLSVGGDDFVGKPVNENILLAKLKAHSRTVEYDKELREINRELHYHRLEMDREHEIVDHILNNGLQRNLSSCENVSFRFSPMTMFNGDILLMSPSPSGGVYVLLGDFTGHGLSAAIGCLPTADIFYAMTSKQAGVGDIAAEMNKRLQYLLPSNMFFCATIIEMNHSGDRLSIWSGGINDILLTNPQGEIIERLQGMHMPLGILGPDSFDSTVRVIKPPRSTRLYAYSDGVIETHSPSGEMFGEERLEALFLKPNADRIAQIFDSIEAFRQGDPQDDDISVVELVCEPVTYKQADASEFCIMPPTATANKISLPWRLSLMLSPEHLRERDIIPQLLQIVVNIDGLSVHQDLLYTILTELYNNAVEHGLLRLDSSGKSDAEGFSHYYQERAERLKALDTGSLLFKLKVEPGGEGGVNRLTFSFTDDGPGFDFKSVYKPEADQDDCSFGRGLSLASSLCERLEYSQSGRKVEVTYLLS